MKLDFIRGHMGGNLIILLKGSQIPGGKELETAIKLLGPNYLYAHEAGILYPAEGGSALTAKIAEPTVGAFISACGGFTQVLGVALVETALGEALGIDYREPLTEVLLHTDCGPTRLFIETKDQKAVRIKTDMDCFVRDCYERGVGVLNYNGLEVMQAGKFLVINADRFKEVYPQADFTGWNPETRDILIAIQERFENDTGEIEHNVALYDWNPEHGGDLRAVYPHYLAGDYYEPSCGTGTVALGIAVLAWKELNGFDRNRAGLIRLKVECGGGEELGGPDWTDLEIKVENGRVKTASFSHSQVEITAVGEAWL